MLATPLFASENTEQGWLELLKNNETEAIRLFNTAIEEDAEDGRAYLGLSYAYDMLLDDSSAWVAFRKALEVMPNPYPYIYAAQFTRRFSSNMYKTSSGAERVIRHVLDEPDTLGILKAMAYEVLGNIEERAGRVNDAKKLYSNLGAIFKWKLIGPFHNISGSGHDKTFPPRNEDRPDAVYKGSDGRNVSWFAPPNTRIDGWQDFARHFPAVYGVFFAQTYVHSPTTQRVQLRLGTSGAYRLFVNNQLASETINEHNNDVDTYITEVTLHEGWNRILVKCDNSKLDRCNFLLRLTDANGNPFEGLETSLDAKPFSNESINPTLIANPFIRFLEGQLEQYPDRLENAFLLVEAHLRNDEVDEAEVVIRRVLKKHPDCIAAMMLAIEAYQRSERTDEIIATVERITSLRPDLPLSLSYSFLRATSTEQLDSATNILARIKEKLPGTIDYYDAAISLARMKNEADKVVALQAEAFERFPANVGYASAAAYLSAKTERGYDGALAIVERHLASNYSESGLLLKASIQEESKRYDEWLTTYQQLFELSPAAPGYHSRMADSYAARKQWKNALDAIQLALADAPSVTWMLYRAGVFKRTLADTIGAAIAFQKAIDCEPANFDAREALRELRNVPSPFSLMTRNNIDSMVRSAPNLSALPDEKAVVLLSDAQRVVYDGSRCELRYEYLIRVLSTQGIDQYKELTLPGGGNSSLVVEKATVIKPSGREVPADRNGSHAVFKGLEVGDFVYMRTRIQVSSRGSLSGYFMDEFWADDYVPVKVARYSLLVPSNENFFWTFINGEVNHTVTSTPQGDLHVWELRDLPPIKPEDDMPNYDVIARGLQLSSIPRWSEIVNWYYDIARTKTRTSLDVHEKMDELFPKGTNYSDSAIVAGVYKYITNDIRYSSVPFRQSGIVPQEARDVLVSRIGDCKDVATLCISMLAERNIKAYHVLVKTNTAVTAIDPLPSIDFDHAIVMAVVNGKNLFMDLTADNVPLGSVPFADLGAFSLLIREGESAPFHLDKNFFTPNNLTVTTAITLNSDLSARITQQFTHTGARTQFYRSSWKDANKADLERWLVEGLSADLPDVKLADYSITNLDTLLPTLQYTLVYDVPDYTMEASNLLLVRLPWYAPYEPASALSYKERKYPYEYANYLDTLFEVMTLTLPSGYEPYGLTSSESFTNPISSVERTVRNNNGMLGITRKAVYKKNLVPTEAYQEYKTFHNDVARSDRQSLLLLPKGTVINAPAKSVKSKKR